MKKSNYLLAGLTLGAAVIVSGTLEAHTSVAPKSTPDEYLVRKVHDGTSSVINEFVIPHGCNGETIIATSMLFPNGMDPVIEEMDGKRSMRQVSVEELYLELEYDSRRGASHNVVMGPKPAINANWKFQDILSGPVPEHYNHGMKDTDVRAFVYKGGNLPNGYLGLLPWRASFGGIKEGSCVKEIQVRIPIVNYCQRHPSSPARYDAWIGRFTPEFDDPALVSGGSPEKAGFWPFISIVNTTFDEDQCGEGMVFAISPSDADIDTFLPMQSFK